MLARLQRLTTGLLLALWLGWIGWNLSQGLALQALLGALVIAFAHAVWLGLGMLAMALSNRRDPAPAATLSQVLGAWWSEVLLAPQVFCWRQPFRSQAELDFLPADAVGRTGVVLIHGFVCNRGLWNPWMRRFRQMGRPFAAVNLEPVFGDIDDYAVAIEMAVAQLEQRTGCPPLLVGHSMGGLAIRAWLRRYGGDHRLCAAVTVGTPHAGTQLASLAFSPNGRQMQPGNAWLMALAAQETDARRSRFLCLYSHCDNIVFPASSALLAGADEMHVPGAAHVDLVHRPSVMAQVLSRLEAADRTAPQHGPGPGRG